MKYPITVDTIRRIQTSEGETLDVKPYPDGPEWVYLCNSDEVSEECFGEISLPMEPQFARLLGESLIKCADEIEEEKK